jgi:hypothetical protein
LPTTIRISDELKAHSRSGLLWTTFFNAGQFKARVKPQQMSQNSPADLAEEASF